MSAARPQISGAAMPATATTLGDYLPGPATQPAGGGRDGRRLGRRALDWSTCFCACTRSARVYSTRPAPTSTLTSTPDVVSHASTCTQPHLHTRTGILVHIHACNQSRPQTPHPQLQAQAQEQPQGQPQAQPHGHAEGEPQGQPRG